MTEVNNAPPGWYPSEGGQRYWDGNQWVGELRPIEPAEFAPADQGRRLTSDTESKRRLGKSEEEKAARQARKEQESAQRESAKQLKQADKELQQFLASPVGRARAAFSRGDSVFQYELNVMTQQAIIVAMIGSSTSKTSTDPSEILNAVCREGWDLVNGSFVFVHEGEQSRDKFLASGQNVATKGRIMGYYLFRRSEAGRKSQGP